ncbi:uncharacterized protein TM35_000501050, partial [Trypanosoma theileri]
MYVRRVFYLLVLVLSVHCLFVVAGELAARPSPSGQQPLQVPSDDRANCPQDNNVDTLCTTSGRVLPDASHDDCEKPLGGTGCITTTLNTESNCNDESSGTSCPPKVLQEEGSVQTEDHNRHTDSEHKDPQGAIRPAGARDSDSNVLGKDKADAGPTGAQGKQNPRDTQAGNVLEAVHSPAAPAPDAESPAVTVSEQGTGRAEIRTTDEGAAGASQASGAKPDTPAAESDGEVSVNEGQPESTGNSADGNGATETSSPNSSNTGSTSNSDAANTENGTSPAGSESPSTQEGAGNTDTTTTT